MAAEKPQTREQERSIRARKQMLFESDEPKIVEEGIPRKPFLEYLRKTPAAPLPSGTRAILYTVLGLVGLMLVAALWTAFR